MKPIANHRKIPRRGFRLSPRLSAEAAAPSSHFDPTQPEDGALIVAEVLRDQFNALHAEVMQRVTQDQLSAEIAALDAQLADYQARITALEAEVSQLQTDVAGRPP